MSGSTNQCNTASGAVRYLRAALMAKRCGVSTATFWRWARKPDFPAAYRPTPGTTLWAVNAVDDWLAGTRGGKA